ncbi:hypothetical protein SRHO_G00316500 [Serrasalmus rhombeus]
MFHLRGFLFPAAVLFNPRILADPACAGHFTRSSLSSALLGAFVHHGRQRSGHERVNGRRRPFRSQALSSESAGRSVVGGAWSCRRVGTGM